MEKDRILMSQRDRDVLKVMSLVLKGERTQAGNILYASLFEDHIARIDLHGLAHSHMPGSGAELPSSDPASQLPPSPSGLGSPRGLIRAI